MSANMKATLIVMAILLGSVGVFALINFIWDTFGGAGVFVILMTSSVAALWLSIRGLLKEG